MSYEPKARDIAVQRICNWLINNVASREYRAFVTAIVGLGRKRLDDVVKIEWTRGEQ